MQPALILALTACLVVSMPAAAASRQAASLPTPPPSTSGTRDLVASSNTGAYRVLIHRDTGEWILEHRRDQDHGSDLWRVRPQLRCRPILVSNQGAVVGMVGTMGEVLVIDRDTGTQGRVEAARVIPESRMRELGRQIFKPATMEADWLQHSCTGFVEAPDGGAGELFFIWTWWGDAIAIDLRTKEARLAEGDDRVRIAATVSDICKTRLAELLEERRVATSQAREPPVTIRWELRRYAHLAGVSGCDDCIPLLRDVETIADEPETMFLSVAGADHDAPFPKVKWRVDLLLACTQMSLRRLGTVPDRELKPFLPYVSLEGDAPLEHQLGRDPTALRRGMTTAEALAAAGIPDRVWTDRWEYDIPDGDDGLQTVVVQWRGLIHTLETTPTPAWIERPSILDQFLVPPDIPPSRPR